MSQLYRQGKIYLKAHPGIILLAIGCLVPATLLLVSYGSYFTAVSLQPEKWGHLGDYLSGTLGIILSAATVGVLVYASVVIPRDLDENRKNADEKRLAVELAQQFYHRDFYIDIIAPSWEIATKWLCWKGESGDAYRCEVCAGQVQSNLELFRDQEDVQKIPYSTPIRFKPHFLPYDFHHNGPRNDGPCIRELSEHQVLNLWLQFWCNLEALLENNLVDEETIRVLFSDWYVFWLKFMLQLRFAEQVFSDCTLSEGRTFKQKQHEQLEKLEKVLFKERSDVYNAAISSAETLGKKIGLTSFELHAEHCFGLNVRNRQSCPKNERT